MEYREYRVQPPLDSLVECVWFLRGSGPGSSGPGSSGPGSGGPGSGGTGNGGNGNGGPDAEPLQRVLPDGCIELIVHFAEAFAAVSDSGASTRQATSVLVGMLTRPMVLQPPATVETMGVRFRPGGAYPFVRVSLAALTDRAVRLDDIWGAFGRRLIEQLGDASTDAARVSIITRELRARLVHANASTNANAHARGDLDRDRLIDAAIDRLTHTAGRASIADIATRAGVTTRHLQRRFADRVGVGPKLLARILRFQNTLRHRTATTPIEWARVAIDCGYADQSHLIREYAAFAGETPASLLAAEGELSSYFTAPQRLATLLGARR